MGPEANDWCPKKRETWTREKPRGQGLGEAGGSSALRCLDGGLWPRDGGAYTSAGSVGPVGRAVSQSPRKLTTPGPLTPTLSRDLREQGPAGFGQT